MLLQVLRGLIDVLTVPEVYVGAPVSGALLAWSARFLARGYAASPELFDRVLSANVFTGTALFLLLAGPGMFFGSDRRGWLNFWVTVTGGNVTLWSGFAIVALGFAAAVLMRAIFPLTRVWSCYGQALFVLAGVVHVATGGHGRLVPNPGTAIALAAAGLLVVGFSQAIVRLLVDRLQAAGFLSALRRYDVQASIATTPVVIALAVALYVSWLRIANQL